MINISDLATYGLVNIAGGKRKLDGIRPVGGTATCVDLTLEEGDKIKKVKKIG